MTPKETGYYLTVSIGDKQEEPKLIPIEEDRWKGDWRKIFAELETRSASGANLIESVAIPDECFICIRDHAVEYSHKIKKIPVSTRDIMMMDEREPLNRMHFSIPASGWYTEEGQLWTSTLELEGKLPGGESVKIVLAYEPPVAPEKVE